MQNTAAESTETWIAELSTTVDSESRRALLVRHSGEDVLEVSHQLYDEALRVMRIDLDRAERISEALLWATEDLEDDRTRGQALRMGAHILYLRGRYEAAVAAYEAAELAFEQVGDEVEVARTISAALHALVYLGQGTQALAKAERARGIFIQHGDTLRLARLDVNLGNLFYRQDRFADALAMYERAREPLRKQGDAQDLAIVLRNMAVCQLSLSHFDEALDIYRDAREFTEQHDLPLLLAEADYNIAYLYYLRGEYTRAVELYEAARARCASVGDAYHRSLCDLDQAEIYLEVNLVEEAAVLAADAFSGFQKLGMRYELAKASTFRALAASRLGQGKAALGWLTSARSLFSKEKNRLWPALIDFYKAAILFEQGSCEQARKLCNRAMLRFRGERMKSKAALCELLLARMDQSEHLLAEAKAHCQGALELLDGVEAPVVNFQARVLLGRVMESSGCYEEAFADYEQAHEQLETLRGHLLIDEMKISFLKDKLSVYEGLVVLSLQGNDETLAFEFMERAKSRSLADTIASRIHTLTPRSESAGALGIELETVVEKLSCLRHQQRREEMGDRESSVERLSQLAEEALACELEMRRIASRVVEEDPQFSSLLNAGTVKVSAIQESLAEDSVILEYYEARGTIYACVLDRKRLRITPVAVLSDVRRQFGLLQFQLSKFRLRPEYIATFSRQMLASAETHLRELYRSLIAPIRAQLIAGHLVIVPHGVLHCVPFHALLEGDRYLIDDFSISYSPSASVHHLCTLTEQASTHDSLVLGIPDSVAPGILGEVNELAEILPRARTFVGESATAVCLREYAAVSRVIHIAAHGRHRDNAMFSSISLADSNISLFDLYQLPLDAELVTLSGCGTGLNAVVGGDELLGMVRGLLYAGARSVLASLWDVNDASTALFMRCFYQNWEKTQNRAQAVQIAVRELRKSHPHPYYWAPFVLIGKNH